MKKGLFFTITALCAALFFASATLTEGLQIGDTAPDFELTSVDGKKISFASFPEAKGYIVTFTCNTCPFAKMYEQRLIDLHNNYAPKGYPVIAINPNDPGVKPGDSFEAMKALAAEKSYPFPYVMDTEQTVFPAYGATKTPHIFLLDADKKVQYIGAIDDNPQDANMVKTKYVENAIAALEAGTTIDPATTKAVGCGIKVKPTSNN